MKIRSALLSLVVGTLFLLPTGLCAESTGEYIITVKDGVTLSQSFLEAYDLTPITEEDHGLYLTDKANATRLAKHHKVEAVEKNATVTLSSYHYNDTYFDEQWAFDAINGSELNHYSTVYHPNVVVIDTGFDFSHEDAGSNIFPGSDFVETPPGSSHIAKTTKDYFNHGTAVVGVIGAAADNNLGIAGLFRNCNIYVTSIFAPNERGEAEGSNDAVCAAIYDAVDRYDADVISMSFGDQSYSTAMDQAIEYAYDHGVLLIAAAGNINAGNADNVPNFPACLDGVISVANANSTTTIDSTSVYNEYVDVAAPGSAIYTLNAYTGAYSYFSGTSLATPHVTALAAYAKALYPTLTPDDFEQYLRLTAQEMLTEGYDIHSGYGMIDCEKLHRYLSVRFRDVPLNEWYTTDIYELASNGTLIGSGNNCFYPENNITRAEFVTILARLNSVDLKKSYGVVPFYDVNQSHWHYNVISWAYHAGLAFGNDDGSFAPDAPVTREELSAFLVRYMQTTELSLPSAAALSFTDRNAVSAWARDDVSVLCQTGILHGFPDGSFRPQASATRSQAAKMIHLLQKEL